MEGQTRGGRSNLRDTYLAAAEATATRTQQANIVYMQAPHTVIRRLNTPSNLNGMPLVFREVQP